MALDMKSFLTNEMNERFSQLINLAAEDRSPALEAKFRFRAKQLVDDIREAVDGLENLSPVKADPKIAAAPRAIHAIVAFLGDSGVPLSAEEIIDKVSARGFGGGGKPAQERIRAGLDNHLTGSGARKGKIKKINGLIGLGEWDEKLFNL
jgi:hypothetical protein